MYIDDCIKGITGIMYSNIEEPLNLGSSEMVSINGLVDIVEGIAGYKLERKYDLDAPKGVRGRIQKILLSENIWDGNLRYPSGKGMKKTYQWISNQLKEEKKDKKG